MSILWIEFVPFYGLVILLGGVVVGVLMVIDAVIGPTRLRRFVLASVVGLKDFVIVGAFAVFMMGVWLCLE